MQTWGILEEKRCFVTSRFHELQFILNFTHPYLDFLCFWYYEIDAVVVVVVVVLTVVAGVVVEAVRFPVVVEYLAGDFLLLDPKEVDCLDLEHQMG